MEGVTAVNGGELIGMNTNLGDSVSYFLYTCESLVYFISQPQNLFEHTLTFQLTGHLRQQLRRFHHLPGLHWL